MRTRLTTNVGFRARVSRVSRVCWVYWVLRASGSVRRSERGFTLVEVMVAMAVVAVALPALLFALIQQLDGAAYLRDKTLASWVAANKLTELRLVADRQRTLPEGEFSGEARLAEHDWYWWIERENTELPGFFRVEIRVAAEADRAEQPLHTLVAFIAPETANARQ